MQRNLLVMIVLVTLLPLGLQAADDVAVNNTQQQEVAALDAQKFRDDIESLNRSFDEVRRDQLNYKIENSLLKEVYSSNLETVNTVMTIALALFTVLGFLGVRGIFSLRGEFRGELSTFQNVTSEAQKRLDEIERSHKNISEQIHRLNRENEEQNARISTMELHDQAASAFQKNDFERTIELMSLALEANPQDVEAMNQKAMAYISTGKYTEAAALLNKAIEVNPDFSSAVQNLLEALICAGRIEDFDIVLNKHRFEIAKTLHLEEYLTALRLFKTDQVEILYSHMIEHIESLSQPDEAGWCLDWNFEDIKRATKSSYGTNHRKALIVYTDVLSGDLSPINGLARIRELQVIDLESFQL
ncbi:Tetratricopeptide repeat-containing protein [Marinobacter gudaonensis]|uniref:Tetratricopeptide repeat-containing protein n=1 Tax=Marinobacter gudaonensis TaxID=375760 RepID=A0A1I6GQ34_9GAMM|nr:tetratricopeptide repeat protein [Marinobacter gudaonensis]SFR44335.1 Tetratricopeptide repeat-containing protein [Marinobacter gudaonensis]